MLTVNESTIAHTTGLNINYLKLALLHYFRIYSTMKATILILTFLSVLGALANPLDKRADRGSETVSGIGSRKQSILNAGGNTLDLAIAMLET
ncbi:uncharacterized protein N7529_009465 [Penicillium soppii]|jgi:hypothetical protein|uniref:uncharacterized protein n=1 Tax=Penicillium soppii TaxID=69789 RepID=UPI0025466026|nr:uncharacterized protein N7529_009465 [Penicillium soppii]KAJ5855521.1 hypothetical protein N7529_009465 [Penicillium soppii]